MQTLDLTVHTNPTQQCTVQKTPFSIGSDKYNDLVIHDHSVDKGHAKIAFKEGQYYLVDEGSINGTRVGGIRLEAYRLKALSDGNLIQLGLVIIEIKISSPAPAKIPVFHAKQHQTLSIERMRLDAIGLHKSTRPVFGTTLLNDISLSFLPKEFVVIAGVSGGGKSTLMDALNGQRRAKGKVLVDGCDLYKNFNAFKNKIGYVPQDDIVHLELTVGEALNYAAHLRLPSVSSSYRQQRITEVLEQLQLTGRKNVSIERLSGGQRKRLSIAVELISNPSLFFLDEATSGLDPGTELQIMHLLRSLANAGSTVILITHATKNVAIADMVVFLAKGGRLAYVGPPKLAFNYFKVQDFDSIYARVERQLSPSQWEEGFKSYAFYRKFVGERQKTIPQNTIKPVPIKPEFRQQWWVLCRRNLTVLLKNRISLALMLLGAPILGSLNFALWTSDLFNTKTGNASQAITMLFVTVIMAVMSGSLATMSEIAKETAIYRRERSAGLGVVPYVASKFQLAFLLALYQSAVLLACMVAAVKLTVDNSTLAAMYFSLFLASFGSMILGLLVSAVAPSQSVAPLLTILVLVPQVVFGGGILPTNEFNSVGKTFNSMMLTKYPFESLVSLSGLGADVAKDSCWQKTEQQRKVLSEKQAAVCNCYGKNVFKQCKFPGLGKIKKSSVLSADLLKARLLIQGVFDSYGNTFQINFVESSISMLRLIALLMMIVLGSQFIKG
ncbi:ATP-binding cassette domain-containing protein [Halotia branconii]|uniref:ATP-binding cassette domain-containing protein n=1 Tax=Halotia branconii CENA392 TaxID=1539056 RepID=A0AAJ6PCM2_9CYAN|nr:ATP-binding cassette domain-containing protein [Halotia branconii]WGV29055.1 ATP-binding cassette domain-containing protein [Halotia branconii CENA392]